MKQDPTLYEPKSNFCEISSLVGPAIGAIGSLIGGSQAAGAAEDASGAQVEAARIAAGVSREALGFQREMYNVGRADLAPYRNTGAGALQTMNNMFLPGGHPMVQLQGRLGELRAERARLMSGGSAGWGMGETPGQVNALRSIWDSARSGDSSGMADREAAGFDPNFGAGVWEGTFEDWVRQMGSGDYLSGPSGARDDIGTRTATDASVAGYTESYSAPTSRGEGDGGRDRGGFGERGETNSGSGNDDDWGGGGGEW